MQRFISRVVVGLSAVALAPCTRAHPAPPVTLGAGEARAAAPDRPPGAPGNALSGPTVVAVLDIAHDSGISASMMQRTPTAAAQWLVDTHLTKAATMGVTTIILKHPYRWRPEPFEDYRFGGSDAARRTAVHAAIAAAKAQSRPMPRLCAYQALPAGGALAPSDQTILNDQLAPFTEDAWEAIGCKPWQQAMIDQRRLTRVQHLEPVWDVAFPLQWTYGIEVTELFISQPLELYQLIPTPRPEIRCWFYRPLVPQFGETPRDTYLRTARQFIGYCLPKAYTPVLPLDLYTVNNVTAAEVYLAVCPGDFDGNGFVNGDDFDGFMAEFEFGTRFADFDGNAFVNGDDFDVFAGHFEVGC